MATLPGLPQNDEPEPDALPVEPGRRHPAPRPAAGSPAGSRADRSAENVITAHRAPAFPRFYPHWRARPRRKSASPSCGEGVRLDGSCLGIRDRDLRPPGFCRLGFGLHHDAGRTHHLYGRVPGRRTDRRPLRRQRGDRPALPLSRPHASQRSHLLDRRHRTNLGRVRRMRLQDGRNWVCKPNRDAAALDHPADGRRRSHCADP